jgi:hypothetical protein
MLHAAQDDAPLETLEAEYTFMNLEFLKATRMSRVYMVFAATILDVDTLFLVYHVSWPHPLRGRQEDSYSRWVQVTPAVKDCV